MRQKQRGGKRLPYKRKKGEACCTPNSRGYLGRKPYTSRRVASVSFAVPRPQPALPARPLCPFADPPCHAGPQSGPVPVALALVFTPVLPVAPFGALSARHAQRQGFPRALPPRPPRGPCAPDVGLARRPAVFAPGPAAPPDGPPRPTGLPLRLCPRAARPGPKGESNLCERFPRDRRALSREFSQN